MIPGEITIKTRKIEGRWVVSASSLNYEHSVGYAISDAELQNEFPHAVRYCIDRVLEYTKKHEQDKSRTEEV